MTTTPFRCLGRIRDSHDPRDVPFVASLPLLESLPTAVDLTPQCPAVYDQGNLGSCTANAIAGDFEYLLLRQGLADFVPSRLFIYYYERLMEGTIATDSGAMIRDGIKVVNRRGVVPESEWPYDVSKFAIAPSVQCSIDALKEQAVKYRRIPQDLASMKACLASGLPFVFGIDVYQSFMDATGGMIPMPSGALEGGHALLCVGYDDMTEHFLFRNSWSASWGKQGYGVIPYEYLATPELASDFWEIQTVGSVVTRLINAAIERL